jgi:hypothetical protein
MRRGTAWALAVPLMLVSSQAAHAIAYRLVYPEAHVRVAMLLTTGHSYLHWLPLVFGVAAASLLVSLAVAALETARGRAPRGLPAPAFALLPPLGFALQELLELSLHTGGLAWHVVLAPTFVPGLALQLPFALAAYVAARVLLRAARDAGRLLAPPRPARARVAPVVIPVPVAAPRPRVAATRLAKRGPPRPVGV